MDLNLRNVPPELVRGLKMKAVEAELSLKGYCIERLGELLQIVKKPSVPTKPQSTAETIVGGCPHGFNTRKFCLTMKGGCK